MTEIEFKRGEFREYRATIKVHLGKIERDIYKDDVIGFDGQTVDIAGEKFAISTVRAAITQGLFVPVGQEEAEYVPPAAKIVLHNPEDASEKLAEVQTVEEDDLVVGDLKGANLGQREGKMVPIATDQGGVPLAPVTTTNPVAPTFAEQGNVVGQVVQADDQGGVPVATLGNPVTATKLKSATDVNSEIRKVEAQRKTAPKSKAPAPSPKKAAARKSTALKAVGKVDVGDGVKWDMALTWQKRAKAATELKDQPDVLRRIMKVETSQGVKNRIQKVLDTPPPE